MPGHAFDQTNSLDLLMAQQSIMLKIIPKICGGEEEVEEYLMWSLFPHTYIWLLGILTAFWSHHDDADTNANSTDDVQLVVEYLIDSSWTALRGAGEEKMSQILYKIKLGPQYFRISVCRKEVKSYRGDEDLQSLLLGADVFGRVDHCPRGATAVELWWRKQTARLELLNPRPFTPENICQRSVCSLQSGWVAGSPSAPPVWWSGSWCTSLCRTPSRPPPPDGAENTRCYWVNLSILATHARHVCGYTVPYPCWRAPRFQQPLPQRRWGAGRGRTRAENKIVDSELVVCTTVYMTYCANIGI